MERPGAIFRFSMTPNPLASSGTLRLTSPGGQTRITLHDNLGRDVATLFDGMLASGDHALPVDLSGVSTGSYLVRVAVGGTTPSSGMVFVSR
jgi:hypothetical protein